MLEFLKESTFKANDVILRALNILKKHYLSVAGLCFLLFVTYNLSAFLAVFLAGTMDFIRIIMLLLFVVLYFGLQLVLIKRAVLLAQNTASASLWDYVPTVKQFFNFIFGLTLYSLLLAVVYLVCSIIALPLLYTGIKMETISYEINPFLTGLVMMLILIRISFFPFFIIVNDFNIFRACRLSIAFTKGNVTNLLFIMFCLASTYILQIAFDYLGYSILAKISSAVNTFLVIPLVSVVMAVVYIDMVKEYKGSDDPEFFKNIL